MFRNALRINQKKFAKAAGLTTNFISLVEKDARNLSRLTLHKIERRFGIPEGVIEFAVFDPGESLSPELRERIGMTQTETLGIILGMLAKRGVTDGEDSKAE